MVFELKEDIQENESVSPGSRIAQIIKNAKSSGEDEKIKLQEVKKKERENFDKEKERLQKELEDNEIDCPTCSSHNHEHKLKKTEKGTLKCVGEDCNQEFSLLSNQADYKCENCSTPHMRPKNKEDEADDICLFCGGNSFIRPEISYDKIREKVKKKQKVSGKTNGVLKNLLGGSKDTTTKSGDK